MHTYVCGTCGTKIDFTKANLAHADRGSILKAEAKRSNAVIELLGPQPMLLTTYSPGDRLHR